MKQDRYKNSFGILVLLLAAWLLPAGMQAGDPPGERDIGNMEGIVCPDDIVTNTDPGQCFAVVDYTPPEDAYLVEGLPPGSDFPVGVTTNVYSLNDDSDTCSFTVTVNAAASLSVVLGTDGSVSQDIVPQGSLRYQRVFYLITPAELQQSELEAGMEINSIGFTIGVAQDIATGGKFRLYLENTTDEVSRIDDDWQTATSETNSLSLALTAPGEYEWKVRALCSGTSGYSELASFDNGDPGGCRPPINPETSGITASSATFSWEMPDPAVYDNFILVYGESLTEGYTTVYPAGMTYTATGLEGGTNYQWGVRTACTDGESTQVAASFITLDPDVCGEPSGLAIEAVYDTAAEVSWVFDGEATYYELSYRRVGTTFWTSTISFDQQFRFNGLDQGTAYEWRVRTICEDGSGSFADGAVFSTTGAGSCFPPEGLKAGNISLAGTTLSWLVVPNASSYEVSYRLKGSITWTSAIEGMTEISVDTMIIPAAIGPMDIPFEGGNSFAYTGDGLYVAWEYSNPSGDLSDGNTAMATGQNSVVKDINGLDSLYVILGFDGRTNRNSTAFPAALRSGFLRPETRFGSSALQDVAGVNAIYTLGQVAIPAGCPLPVSALVRNFTGDPLTLPVTLEIRDNSSGDLLHSETIEATLTEYCGALISFTGWDPPGTGTYIVSVTVPVQTGEGVTDNNAKSCMVEVGKVMQSFDDGTTAVGGTGFGDGEGLVLARFSMNGCGKVNSAKIYLHMSAEDHELYAVVMDADGNILDSSQPFTPGSSDVNDYHTFYFNNPPVISNSDYYTGLAQAAGFPEDCNPVGVQWEGTMIRESAYYRADLDGSNLEDHPYPGRLMIQAEILPGMPVPFISGDGVLCDGNTATLRAASKTTRFADHVLSSSSENINSAFGAVQALGSPDVYPEYGSDPGIWLSETADGQREYLELHFPDPEPVNFIDIYQVLNPGAVDTVRVKDDQGEYQVVYAVKAVAGTEEAAIEEIRFPLTSYPVTDVLIEMASDSISGFNALDAVGIGQISDPATFASYTWSPGMETTPSIEVDSPGSYSLTVTNTEGCSLSESIELTSPTLTIPSIGLNGPAEFCQGDSVILTSSEAENNTWSTGENTQSIVVTSSGLYSVTYDNGCETATSEAVEITVYPLPVVAITGGGLCPGGVAILDAGDGYESYAWSTGETTQTISVATLGYFTVTVTDEHGCEGSGSVQTFYAPGPTPTITGDPLFCPGGSTTLNAGDGYSSYLWSTGQTTPAIQVSTPGTISVTVTNSYGCSGTASIITGEYVPPQPVITGTLSLCAGSSTVLDAGDGYASYQWTTGQTSPVIVVTEAGSYSVTVTDVNGCQGSAGVTVDSQGSPPGIPGPITGPSGGICQAADITYSIQPMSNTTHYVWTVPAGMTVSEGQGTTEVTVSTLMFSEGYISVAASNGCGQSPSWNGRRLFVHGSPDMPGNILGQTSGVCGLANLDYTIEPVYGADTYAWTVPAGAVITGGNETNSVVVAFESTFGSGDICVSAGNSCGTSALAQLRVTGAPALPGTISGPALVCSKQKNVAYSVEPVPNTASYTWSVPQQAVIVSGQGTRTIVVNFGTKSGIISVNAANNCGTSELRQLAVEVISCNQGESVTDFDPPGSEWENMTGLTWGSGIQAFYPEVIASSGGLAEGFPVLMSWTLGESVIETTRNERLMLTQGFQQGNYQVIAMIDIPGDCSFDVELYPVPAKDLVNLKIRTDSEPVNLLVEVSDLVGNVIYWQKIDSREYSDQLNLEPFAARMFILKVIDLKSHQSRSFKIIRIKD